MHITDHALARSRQRSIPVKVIELLHALGEEISACGSKKAIALTSSLAKSEFLHELKANGLKTRRKWCDTYLIVDSSSEVVVTAGYRYKTI